MIYQIINIKVVLKYSMRKPNQFGKSHSYPKHRQSYSQSRLGVGGSKKKVKEKSKVLTYFDKLKLAQSQSKGKCTFCLF